MPLHHLVALALVQGLTEFLPISSSGHLVLLPNVMGWADQGLAYDVAAHLGSLVAVVGYFHRDLALLAAGFLDSLRGGTQSTESRLVWLLLAATLPVCIVGYFARDAVEAYLRSPAVIAWATIGFGIVLGIADRFGDKRRGLSGLRLPGALAIGCAQVLALIPGTSRSGITITAGLALGLGRREAARFSFLLAIPVILLAAALESLHLIEARGSVDWPGLAIVFGISALSAFLCIWLFLNLINRVGMLPFVAYRIALGALLLWWF